MYGTDPISGFFGKVKQIIPVFAKSKTNINPNHRTGTHPRLRYDKKPVRRLRLPKNMYSKKEFADQQQAVEKYHESLDKRKQRQLANLATKTQRHFSIQERKNFKANKPIIVD